MIIIIFIEGAQLINYYEKSKVCLQVKNLKNLKS